MKTLLFLTLTFSLSTAFSLGQDRGNGGDATSQEFTFLAKELITYLPYLPPSNSFSNTYKDAFVAAIQETQVHTQENLFLRGVEVDAINYPDKKIIEVSRSRWNLTSSDLEGRKKRQALALHEYLWIIGIDDTNYAYSIPLYQDLMAAKSRWLSTPIAKNLAQAVCVGIVTRDLVTVQQALAMGADPNVSCSNVDYSCPRGSIGTVFINDQKPLAILADRIGDGGVCDTAEPASPDTDTVGLDILKELLSFRPTLTGAANLAARNHAFMAFDLIVDAGASEFDVLYGLMNSYPWSAINSFKKALDNGFNFNTFSFPKNSGDVLATAVIVSGKRADVVELLASRNVIDFCAKTESPSSYGKDRGQVIDFVKPDYLPIIKKYGGPCVP